MSLISAVTQKGQVTIPLMIREYFGLEPKDKVVFIKQRDKVYLRPAIDFLVLAGSVKTKKPFNIKAFRIAAKKLVVRRHV